MFDMAASPCIQCRIDPQLTLRLQAIAVERGLTESAVLKRLVVGAIGMAPASDATVLAVEPIGRRARIYVRLRLGDHALLRERAARRGLASATYVSMLVRAHLRGLSPLPDRELAELSHAAGALGAVLEREGHSEIARDIRRFLAQMHPARTEREQITLDVLAKQEAKRKAHEPRTR
jgi:hypothetical protein